MKQRKRYFILDFDSTFVQIEALDELAKITLKNNPDKNKIVQIMRLDMSSSM